ncbi:FecR domain-containing protein [Sediminitomix flava]|uniref:FecR family protein n=1 Tax=Sediminitomix flava TaxID=379075 RepID=A0A315ZH43_SEDFL|nr:FecR domain-containing protein [Sediminitomix flava]PWJ44925.1 FecR family protein [Sediminitomix flava]
MKDEVKDIYISKYLSGNASAEERRIVEEWLLADASHQKYFDEFLFVWEKATPPPVQQKVNVDAAWDKVRKRALKPQAKEVKLETKPKKYLGAWWAAAAAVVIASLYIFGLQQFDAEMEMIRVATTDVIQEVELPDGTKVNLNTYSSIEYPEKFSDEKRALTLEGEAFFDVNRDPARPFIIDAGKAQVEVLGTSFNVNTKNEEAIEVVVATGKVALMPKEANTKKSFLTLTRNQKGILGKGDLSLKKVEAREDAQNAIAWKTKSLFFEETPLTEVFETLEKNYGVEFEYDLQSIEDRKLSGRFKEQPLGVILETIELSFDNISAERKGNKVEVKLTDNE